MASTAPAIRGSTPKDITGIALSVEKHGDEPPQVLTFYKSNAEVILIGRRSSLSTKPQSEEKDKALFRCPVISRRHAKIIFTQYGNVYLSDLSSHHGTHILRPGEKSPTMIKPDIPSVLADGDTITFGKAVGREETAVHPIIAKVRLLFGAPSTPSESTSSSAPATPAAPTAAVHTSSGRYGIYTPAMTSSSSDSSESEEIEEISPPPQAQRSCAPFSFSFGSRSSYPSHQMHHVFHTRHAHHTQMVPNAPGRLGLLRRILPRVGSIEEIATGHGSSRLSPISVSSISRSPSVVEVSREEIHQPEEPQAVDLSSEPMEQPRAPSVEEDMELESDAPSEYSSKPDLDDLPDLQDAIFDGLLPVLAASSRLCTPEPEPVLLNVDDFLQHHEENFESDSDSDMYSTPAPPLLPAPAAQPMQLAVPMAMPAQMPEPSVLRWSSSEYSSRSSSPAESPSPVQPFDTRVELLKSRLADLEQRMRASSQATSAEPLSEAESEPESNEQPAEVQAQPEQVAPMVASLKEMLQSLDELRKKAEAEMTRELDAIRALRAEAEATATAALARAVVLAPVLEGAQSREGSKTPTGTLKRKRDALEDGDAPEAAPPVAGPAAPVTPDATVVASVPCQALFDRLAEPPRKRTRRTVDIARRVVLGVAKTTAIAAVGAVATWSALAYS